MSILSQKYLYFVIDRGLVKGFTIFSPVAMYWHLSWPRLSWIDTSSQCQIFFYITSHNRLCFSSTSHNSHFLCSTSHNTLCFCIFSHNSLFFYITSCNITILIGVGITKKPYLTTREISHSIKKCTPKVPKQMLNNNPMSMSRLRHDLTHSITYNFSTVYQVH